jgi:hypothetical protein
MHFLYGIHNRKDRGAHRITLTGYFSKIGSHDNRRSHEENPRLFLQSRCGKHPVKRVARVQRELL